MSKLKISDDLSLPLDAVTEPIAILAVRRAGKSNAAVVMAEEMYRNHLHWVAIDPKGDWWGVRSDGTGKGLPIPIFGGSHGDVPLEPGSGAMIADLIIDQRLTCVLDASGFASEGEKIRFLLEFGDRLFRRKTREQEPTHVFFEEADDYCPQKPQPEGARLVHVMARILKQGGSRGLGGTVISQRSAVVNKDILTQCQTMIALRTTSPQDRKAIRDWVSFNGENADIIEELPRLRDGQAWVWSPNWLKITKKIQFRRRSTYDSGSTPKTGGSRQAPATLADIDLGSIRERMAETIARAEAEDPKRLRAQIADLKRQLAKAGNGDHSRCEETIRALESHNKRMITEIGAYIKQFGIIGDLCKRIGSDAVNSSAWEQHTLPQRPMRVAPIQTVREKRPVEVSYSNGKLPDGERAILTACIQHGGCTRQQLTVLSGYKRSTRDAYIARLAGRGYVSVGAIIEPTDDGRAAIPEIVPLPTGEELQSWWADRLPEGERKIFELLVRAYPKSVDRETITEKTEYMRSTRDAYLARMNARGVVEIVGRGEVKASDVLFE